MNRHSAYVLILRHLVLHTHPRIPAHNRPSAYNAYPEGKLGGEKDPRGNALIEGVDSLLTEAVWTSAHPRAPLQAVREKVEPDAVQQGLHFDENLLPTMPARRYDSFDRAMKLVDAVGIEKTPRQCQADQISGVALPSLTRKSWFTSLLTDRTPKRLTSLLRRRMRICARAGCKSRSIVRAATVRR